MYFKLELFIGYSDARSPAGGMGVFGLPVGVQARLVVHERIDLLPIGLLDKVSTPLPRAVGFPLFRVTLAYVTLLLYSGRD